MTCQYCGTLIRKREGVGWTHEEPFRERLGCQLPTPEMTYFPVADSDDMRLQLLEHFVNLSMTHSDLAGTARAEDRDSDAEYHEGMAAMHKARAEGFVP